MGSSDPIHDAKRGVRAFTAWLDDKVAPLMAGRHERQLVSWRDELGLIQNALDQAERITIALVGTTGAGKSTFLNAVLGQELLPVGVMAPCTAFVTKVSRSSDSRYRIAVQFLTRDEWAYELAVLASALKPGEEDDGGERRLVDAARKRIEAVYGLDGDPGELSGDVTSLPLPTAVEEIFAAGSHVRETFESPKEMQAYLRRLIRGESAFWPLIVEVRVEGAYDCIADGLEIVDLPGLNDPNDARVDVTRHFLRTSPFVWVVFPMVRGLTDDVQSIFREDNLLRTLVMSGTYGALSLIGTKADDIDTNVADQFGLDEDCETEELIKAYREQVVKNARQQLEKMVRDLAHGSEETEALKQLIELTKRVRVHATSANAFMKLSGVGRLRRDYGLSSLADTGIPAVREHLAEIARECGAPRRAESALQQLAQLGEEVAFFFGAEGSARSPVADIARQRIVRERNAFSAEIRGLCDGANERLRSERLRLLEALDPLLKESVAEVHRATERWRQIHWATLRAIVQRNGVFKSSSNGRTYDLNEDLTEPLLRQLPVRWEQYFTHNLGRVTGDFELRLLESAKGLSRAIRLIIEGLFDRKAKGIDDQIALFQGRISNASAGVLREILNTVRERRRELAESIPLVAKGRMQPAYDGAKTESGRGMKARILAHLERAALAAASPMYATIQHDLLEGLRDLEMMIAGLLQRLAKQAEEQANIVTENAHVDVDEAAVDPRVSDLLSTMPRIDLTATTQPLTAA